MEFKPWTDAKEALKEAIEYSVCFSNADGGAVVFGVLDRIQGRSKAIHGVGKYDIDLFKKAIFQTTRPHIGVEIQELNVTEGTGKLLIVRIPKGDNPPYGTAQGLFKRRVGKNCLAVDPNDLLRGRISSGAVDWSGQIAHGIRFTHLDPLEIERARAILKSKHPDSELLKINEQRFLQGLEAVKGAQVTNTGLLLFGKQDVLAETCPQNQIHYVHQTSETKVARNDTWRSPLLKIILRIEEIFSGPINPEEELTLGLFKLRIPAFPIETVREALLNAVTHRDYSDAGEILVRHSPRELIIVNPGGFIGGINLNNILRHAPVARNRTLANAFQKLRLVEAAGIGRNRIFIPILSYGKQAPKYIADEKHVELHISGIGFDSKIASFVARRNSEGKDTGLDVLLILRYLKEHTFIDSGAAAAVLQLDKREAAEVLDAFSQPSSGILERKGHTKSATYHLTKGVAKELLGKAAYTRAKGIDATRYSEIVKTYVDQHGEIKNKECRELLGLGDSPSAQVETSRYLKRWSGKKGFLDADGKPPKRVYRLRVKKP